MTLSVHLNIYVQYGNHIFAVIYAKYVYSTQYHMVDCSDSICGTYMLIHLPYNSIKYLLYMMYMPIVVGIFVSSTYLAVT